MRQRWIILWTLLALWPGIATAQVGAVAPSAAPPAQAQRVVRLNLKPAAPPQPALRYHLLPTALEQTSGNAATLYFMALPMLQQFNQEQIDALARLIEDSPDGQFDIAEAEKLIQSCRTPFNLVFAATNRERCEWESTYRTEGFNALLPHLSHLRKMSQLLALDARLRIAKGDMPEALKSLQAGITLAHHLNNDALLIQNLVAAGMMQLMSRQMERLIERPESPNLYWALAGLPHPFIDLRQAMEREKYALQFTFPQLRNLKRGQLTADEARAFMEEMPKLMAMADGANQPTWPGAILTTARLYPPAKRYLVEHDGLSPEKVDGLPVHQVVVSYMLGQYEEALDNFIKWFDVPIWQAEAGEERAEQRFIAMRRENDLPLLAFVPAVKSARRRMVDVDRRLASLQCVEALRAFAAGHDGKLPPTLEEIVDTPAPIDPATGKLFSYQLKGDTAIIDVQAMKGETPSRGWRYEITIAK